MLTDRSQAGAIEATVHTLPGEIIPGLTEDNTVPLTISTCSPVSNVAQITTRVRPHPLTVISLQTNPPGIDPSEGLCDGGHGGDKVNVLLGLGLHQVTSVIAAEVRSSGSVHISLVTEIKFNNFGSIV